MAREIKPTPVLKGKDARKFLAAIKSPRVVSKEEATSIQQAAEKLKKGEKEN